MTDKDFVKNETVLRRGELIRMNWRLFGSLTLFLKLLPLTILTILFASASPSLFRWYAGHYSTQTDSQFRLAHLVWIVILAAAFRILAWILFEVSAMWNSQVLYAKMVKSLSRTRTTFFDENPSARIINRLIRDYDEVRSTAIIFVGDFFNAFVELLSIGIVASLASPWTLLLLPPLLFMFFFIQTQRSAMIAHTRGLSAVASSHVLNRKNDLIEGRRIYILYNKGNALLDRMRLSLRTYLQASLLTFQVEVWGTFWIRIFAEVFSFLVLLFTIGALLQNKMSVPIAGVIISALFGITSTISWLDFSSSLIARSSPHLQRVFEYLDLPDETQVEQARTATHSRSPFDFDSLGDIQFDQYSMSYREGLPLILKDLTLNIRQGSKTALIGRTGSGKSSVIQALMRMVYVQKGDIRIGGQSIFQAETHALRQIFGIVPQFPYLFEGTVASNLDRTGRLEPHLLINALQSVGLSYPLDTPLLEGGQNLSLGERQLICLARVIANDRPFVFMDEPTSGLDPETDAKIQWILKTSLKPKTVLTIAHRPETIKNYDSIIEMSDGKVKNFR